MDINRNKKNINQLKGQLQRTTSKKLMEKNLNDYNLT